MKENNYLEAKIQQEIIMFYRNAYCLKHHSPRHLIFSVPNEEIGKMSQKERIKAIQKKKQTGMMPGASDLIVVRPNETIYCEVKTPTGSQSPEQKDFEKTVTALGFRYILVRSLEEFREKIEKYM